MYIIRGVSRIRSSVFIVSSKDRKFQRQLFYKCLVVSNIVTTYIYNCVVLIVIPSDCS